MEKYVKNKNGITLIALVITIIVLLILAGVSIAMLSGDNSILGRASSARETSGTRQIEERVKLAYTGALTNGKGIINQESLEEELTKEFGAKGTAYTIADSETGTEWVVTVKGTGTQADVPVTLQKPGNVASTPEATPIPASNLTPAELTAIETNNTNNPTDQIQEVANEDIQNSNLKNTNKIRAVLKGTETTEIPIPVDCTYVTGTENTGVVISYKESEFVWVPVPNAIYESSKDDKLPKSNSTGSLTEGHNYTPMAIDVSGHYKGLLYTYINNDITNGAYLLYPSTSSQYQGSSSKYREPATLSSKDVDSENYLSEIGLMANTFATEIENQYDAMVTSVAQYGGFYVGRYETSINGNTVASVEGEYPMTDSTSSGNKWYGMYDKQKKFSGIDLSTGEANSDKLQSSMIWGSQYDAMLNWALKGTDKTKVNFTGNANMSEYNRLRTGSTSTDVINNIYDLEGNQQEWTLEAHSNGNRAWRGGCFESFCAPSHRSNDYTFDSDGYNGSRMTLYIK